MDKVISFNKTYKERLQEYTDVLGGYDSLPPSQILQEWVMFLELSVDPCGWQAIWKIPRVTCENLKIEFPTLVLVYVESVFYEELSANVIIVTLQDDVDIPKEHRVPFLQLWPTEIQDKSICLNLMATANSIDMLRFFYINLFLPWDMEEECKNWFDKHLSTRLRLFYDLRNGTIPPTTADKVKGLLTEARHLLIQQNCLQMEIEDDDLSEPTSQSPVVSKLLDMRFRMMEIRNEVELLENPTLRTALLARKPTALSNDLFSKPQCWAVFEEGNVEDLLNFFHQIKSDLKSDEVKFESNLSLALDNARTNDTIFLSSGKHVISSLCTLSEGGTIKGEFLANNTILSTHEGIMLDCCGEILLENINLDVSLAQCGILVRSGSVTLKNCTITGDFKSSTHQGIIVLAGGKLKVETCKIQGFYTAIVINSKAIFSVTDSIISEVNVGIKCYDNSKIEVRDTIFKNCSYCGIYMETDNADICKEGDFSTLSQVYDTIVENVVSEGIGKWCVIVNQKHKLEPICDLLSNMEINPIYFQSTNKHDEEEDEGRDMEISICSSNLDVTVINVDD